MRKMRRIDAPAQGALADEQLGDKVGAEQEEELHPHRSGGAEGGKGGCQPRSDAHVVVKRRVVRHRVMNENEEEGAEAQDIEFGMVKAFAGRAGQERARGHWAIPKRKMELW
jgi:hypothetical protein